MDNKKTAFNLLLVSFLTLFAELVFIRYLASNIFLLSYYKNAILLSVFLGIGTGFMISRVKRNLIEYLPVATLVLLCIIIYFNDYLRIDLDLASKDESIWPEFWANTKARGVPIFGVLSVFYILIALYFVPLGHETARMMRSFKPLTAYSVNVAGAIFGIAVFELAGRYWLTPLVWFAVILVPLLWWSRIYSTRVTFVINIFAVIISLFLLFTAQRGFEVWSPYSRIAVYPYSDSADTGFISTTNGNPQVGCMNFDYDYTGMEKALLEESKAIYSIPYRFRAPAAVAIAGAGAGNEVAMALRHNAASVDAVELDPVFIAIARVLNPHRPFSDPRVHVHINDARAYFQRTPLKYDLVVIGFLDSQYHLSHMGNIRTENFVYTYESIKRTRELLSENGLLQLNYNAPRPDMRAKLYYILKEVYGDDLVVYAPSKPVTGNISFVAGPGLRGAGSLDIPGFSRYTFGLPPGYEKNIPTDDWPFLYMSGKKIPKEYWSMLVFIPLVSLAFIKTVARTSPGFSLKYFLLGVGFMLLETKSITSFALLFGSTVTVVSIVIASILAAVLLANILVALTRRRGLRLPYLLILLTLAALYFVPLGVLLPLGWGTKLAVSGLIIAAPVFFAAIVFAVSFVNSDRIDVDLGSNIFGAVTGGVIEYASMAFGFKSLYVLSFAAYLLAFAVDMMKKED